MKRFLAAVLLALLIVHPAAAQTLAIINARILTMGPAGNLESGTVLVRESKIVSVGASVRLPPDARVIDGSGKTLTPGLVATVSPLGLNDFLGIGYAGLGSNTERLSAAFEVAADVNSDNPQLGEARVGGVTRAVITPNLGQDKLFAGQAAVIHLQPGLDSVVNPRAALTMVAGELGAMAAGGSRGAYYVRIKEALDVARTFARGGRVDDQRLDLLDLSHADLRALAAVVTRREPILVEVNRASDILGVLQMARENEVNVVLSGAAEAWRVADQIAAANVPVVLDADQNQAMTFDELSASAQNAASLHRAGVLIAFKPGIARAFFPIRTPRFAAGRATRYGLSPQAALAAVTINPARMFGFSDVFGSIETGKDADLVLWSGDPFETDTVARMVMVKGVETSLQSRSRQLRDRYIDTVLSGSKQSTNEN